MFTFMMIAAAATGQLTRVEDCPEDFPTKDPRWCKNDLGACCTNSRNPRGCPPGNIDHGKCAEGLCKAAGGTWVYSGGPYTCQMPPWKCPGPDIDEKCTSYMKNTGCDWTEQYNCPGQAGPGPARVDGSDGYECCCTKKLWSLREPWRPTKTKAESLKWCFDKDAICCTAHYGHGRSLEFTKEQCSTWGGRWIAADFGKSPFRCVGKRECVSIKMTNLKPTGLPKIKSDGGQSYQSSTDANNCISPSDKKITDIIKSGHTKSHTDTYTHHQSWSHTFTVDVGGSVKFSMEEGFIFASEKIEVEAHVNTKHTSTDTTSTTTQKVDTTINSNSHEQTIVTVVPAYAWWETGFNWQQHEVESSYTATAICYDKDGVELERKNIRGTWGGAYLTQSTLFVTDKTNQCPTAKVCECAGLVASTIKGGLECSFDYLFPGNHKFCYIRRDAPCKHKIQLDALDHPLETTGMWMKSGDPCNNPVLGETSAHFTLATVPSSPGQPTCGTLPGYELSYTGNSLRVIYNGKCGLWTCEDGGTYDIAECPVTPVKETDDCLIGGQVVRSSESIPLIYGTKGCITATCMTGDLAYGHCDVNTAEPTKAPTSPDLCLFHGERMLNGDNHRVINANGICIHAECQEGSVIYEECVPSTAKCTLPDYTNLDNGKTSNVHGVNGVCGEFTCTNGILDVRPCSTQQASEDSFAGSFRKVGTLMDRLDKYLEHQEVRRDVAEQLVPMKTPVLGMQGVQSAVTYGGSASFKVPQSAVTYKGHASFKVPFFPTYSVDVTIILKGNNMLSLSANGSPSDLQENAQYITNACTNAPYKVSGSDITIVGVGSANTTNQCARALNDLLTSNNAKLHSVKYLGSKLELKASMKVLFIDIPINFEMEKIEG